MIYAKVTFRNGYLTGVAKAIIENKDVLEQWKVDIEKAGCIIEDMFVDYDYGTICILTEDFKY